MNNLTKKIALIQSLCSSLRYKAGKTKPPKPKSKSSKSKSSKSSKSSSKKIDPCKKRALPGKEQEKAGLWRKICLFGVIPSVLGLTAIVFSTIHEHERPEFVPYEYLRRHNKRFAWGDGTKSFFHNPRVNPLADGYEED